MRIDRISDQIYTFISDLYVQAAATVVLTSEGAVVIDTLPFPAETRQILDFCHRQLGPRSVRYLVLTHHHPDHVYGAYLFAEAQVIAHHRCLELLESQGAASLARAKAQTPALDDVDLRLPDMVFSEELHLHLGDQHIELMHLPGHTSDGIGGFVHGERVFIASDAMMPVPHIVGGDVGQLKSSLRRIRDAKPSFVVQGHGDVLLKGEVNETVQASIAYLDKAMAVVQEVITEQRSPRTLRQMDIETFGLSRIPLDGAVNQLHLANLIWLYKELSGRAVGQPR
ncbi:MAG: MBL fold metallo-hydrolase [Chloroflexi bacterium]|nr:MBL fold metallo-hydrolase [Chloroflexota bacterium]